MSQPFRKSGRVVEQIRGGGVGGGRFARGGWVYLNVDVFLLKYDRADFVWVHIEDGFQQSRLEGRSNWVSHGVQYPNGSKLVSSQYTHTRVFAQNQNALCHMKETRNTWPTLWSVHAHCSAFCRLLTGQRSHGALAGELPSSTWLIGRVRTEKAKFLLFRGKRKSLKSFCLKRLWGSGILPSLLIKWNILSTVFYDLPLQGCNLVSQLPHVTTASTTRGWESEKEVTLEQIEELKAPAVETSR